MLILVNFLFIAHYVFSVELRIDPLVRIEQGLVRGQQASDGEYSTFLGIPYAQVNLDDPFGPAQPPPYFEEVFDAYDGSIICPQSMSGPLPTETNTNDEQTLDCLRLNAFVPDEASSQNLLPVLVWIHGGGFEGGSAAQSGVRNLVTNGIVLVTINYRLGPYGFMCLDVPAVPGNRGLKDQYEALRWVKNNIAAFGGNPYDVTIAGESAGSCSVLLQLYSSKEKLFNKVIAESGTPQNEGMFVNADVNAAIKLANYLGHNTSDTEEALNFLANASPNLVTAAYKELNFVLRPCQEKSFDGVDNFVDSDPYSLSNSNKIENTPIIIGHTSKEHINGLIGMYGDDYYTKDPFYEKMKDNFNLNEEQLNDVSKVIRHFYIGDEPVSEDAASELEDFDSDFVFNHSVQRLIAYLLEDTANPVYQYVFSYVGDSGAAGASHASEVRYIFANSNVTLTEEDKLLIDRITTLWSNFVKYGNPTPEVTDLLPVIWEPVTANTRPYLDINTELQLKHRVYKNRMSFWDLFYSVYQKYSNLIKSTS